jgi:hypothetical protein
MSLTSLLQTKEARRRFREEFEKPTMEAEPSLTAPPISSRPSQIGTAFDYLLRFVLRRENEDVVFDREWTAEAAVRLLSGEEKERAEQIVRRAKDARDQFVESGDLSEEVLTATLRLARIDLIVRTGADSLDDIGSLDAGREEDLQDLHQLYEAIPTSRFQARERCLLNPTFGKASVLVGGADADLLIDDLLVDVKTVKEAVFSREMFNQLLGYYTLYIIDGIGELEEKPTIRRIGVYFSRHAHFRTIALEEVVDRSTYPDFVEWVALRAVKLHSG